MRSRAFLFLVVIGLTLGFLTPADGPTGPRATGHARGLSIVPINPETAKTLQEQGRHFKYPFPNSANEGKKFNPRGDNIDPLVTAEEQRVLVIFVQFTTDPPGGPTTRLDLALYFDSMLFGTTYDPPEYAKAHPGVLYPTDRTLKNYFEEVSYGQVDVVTLNMPSALGWKNSGRPYSYYCEADGIHDNGFGPYPRNAQGMVIDAVKAADPVVDFSKYAIDGEVPNLFVVHAGTGAEWNVDPSIIWSHSWNVADGTEYPNGYTADGVKIVNYATMPEVGGDLTGYLGRVRGPYPPTVGVYAHEYGHVLGLPDQYDYGYESGGTGIFSVMAGGSWNMYPYASIFNGNSPAHLDAWSKYRLGFVTPVDVTSDTAVTLAPVETDAVVYKMVVPNSSGREYFLFENRQRVGFDEGLVYYASPHLYAVHGLAIYHVDEGVLTHNYWRPNEAENWKEFRSEGWRKAWTGETHYGISLVQADDRWHLEHGMNAGDPGDLYPGYFGIATFGNATSPNSSNYYFWAGSEPKFGYSGVTAANIREISISEDVFAVSADLSFVPWTPGKK